MKKTNYFIEGLREQENLLLYKSFLKFQGITGFFGREITPRLSWPGVHM